MGTGYVGLDKPNRNCKQYAFPRRGGCTASGTIVVHTAENYGDSDGPDGGAEGVANYLSTRTTYGSYHELVDSDSIVPYLPIDYEAFHETRTNHWAVGISAACRTTDWTTKPSAWVERMYRNLAHSAAGKIREFAARGIQVPVRHLTRDEALAKRPGFIGHGEIDTHRRTDPGSSFDWGRFFRYINEAIGTPPAPEIIPSGEDDAMVMVRNKAGAVYLLLGSRVIPVAGPDYANWQKAGIAVVQLSDDGFNKAIGTKSI